MFKWLVSALLVTVILFAVNWKLKQSSLKKPPNYRRIEHSYYVCYEQKLLYGGITSMNQVRSFSGKGERDCCNTESWEKINKTTFRYLASKWYGIVWENEPDGDFWMQIDQNPRNPRILSWTG